MTIISYYNSPRSDGPTGNTTLDTSRLVICTDGCTFMRSTSDNSLVPLTHSQRDELKRYFGSKVWSNAIEAVGELS